MADGKDITDRIAKEENAADVAAFDRYTVEPLKRGAKYVYESFVGTPEQNEEASKRMKARDEKNPDSALAKINKVLGYKKGGSVSSASKRADGIAQRGKTKGRMV